MGITKVKSKILPFPTFKHVKGMNLVAKEFVACQIGEPGVLILSPFTGAGETMHEALICNPLEEHELADTMHRALTMPLVRSL